MNAKPKEASEFRMGAAEFDRMMRGAMDAPPAKKAPVKKTKRATKPKRRSK